MKRILLAVCAVVVATACPKTKSNDASFTLDNGLQVTLQPVEGNAQACVLILFEVGEAHDPDGQAGLAHLVEHLYVTSATGSTKGRTAQDIAQNYPSGWNAQTGSDYTVVAYVVSNDRVVAEIRDAAARMGDLHVTDGDVEREKQRMRLELHNMFAGIPRLAVMNTARELASPSASGGRHGGDIDAVNEITLDDIRQRLQTVYKPKNARLVVVGGFDSESVRNEIETAFRNVPSGEAAKRPVRSLVQSSGAVEVMQVASPEAIVSLAYPAPPITDENYAAFSALAIRLLRETQNRTHGMINAAVVYTPLDRPDVLSFTPPMQSDETIEEAIERVDKEVEAIIGKNLTKEDKTSAKEFSRLLGVDGYPDMMLRGNPYGAAFSIARTSQLGFDAKAYSHAMDTLTEEQVRAAAAKYFTTEQRAAAVIGK